MVKPLSLKIFGWLVDLIFKFDFHFFNRAFRRNLFGFSSGFCHRRTITNYWGGYRRLGACWEVLWGLKAGAGSRRIERWQLISEPLGSLITSHELSNFFSSHKAPTYWQPHRLFVQKLVKSHPISLCFRVVCEISNTSGPITPSKGTMTISKSIFVRLRLFTFKLAGSSY